MEESLTQEEIGIIIDLKNKAIIANLSAKLAELEAKNYILTIYNKYNIKNGIDQIVENGKIIRGQDE